MHSVKIYKDIDDPVLKHAWDELYHAGAFSPQASHQWTSLWCKELLTRKQVLLIIAVLEGSSVIAIAPFMIEKHFMFSQVRFLGTGLTDFHGLLVRTGDASIAYSMILDYLRNNKPTNLLNLEQLPDSSPDYKYLQNNSVLKKREMVKCPTLNLDFPNFEDFLKQLPSKLRKKWKYYHRRIQKMGNLEFRVIDNHKDKLTYFQKMLDLHISRWDAANFESKFSSDVIRTFILGAATTMDEVIGYVLLLDDNIISYQIGFLRNDIYYIWNSSFDPQFQRYSVGDVVQGLVLEDLINKGFKQFNFMRGDYEYKRRWMSANDKMISNHQFLLPITNIKGYLSLNYYLHWKWWLKKHISTLLNLRTIQRLRMVNK